MRCNVGLKDKRIRLVLGAVVVVLGYILDTWIGLIGLVIILTAVFRFCPMYLVINKTTYDPNEKSSCGCGCNCDK